MTSYIRGAKLKVVPSKQIQMKLNILLAIGLMVGSLSVMAGEPVTFIKGNKSIFKGDNSFLVEMDLSATAIDGLDTEEGFIEYNKGKAKDPEKWENGWKKDKAAFLTRYVETMSKDLKKTKLKVSSDDPDSKYKMILKPNKIKTGTPVRYSSVEMKISVVDMATQEEVAVLHVVEVKGVKWEFTTPTMGITVSMALMNSARVLDKFIKKTLAGK